MLYNKKKITFNLNEVDKFITFSKWHASNSVITSSSIPHGNCLFLHIAKRLLYRFDSKTTGNLKKKIKERILCNYLFIKSKGEAKYKICVSSYKELNTSINYLTFTL